MESVQITGMARRSDERLYKPQIESVEGNKNDYYNVEILDISRVGLRFRSEKPYEKGGKVLLKLHGSDSEVDISVTVKGTIINAYTSGVEGAFEYGVKFNAIFQWHEMNLIHNFVHLCKKRRKERSKKAKEQSGDYNDFNPFDIKEL